jgi:outer membrane protein
MHRSRATLRAKGAWPDSWCARLFLACTFVAFPSSAGEPSPQNVSAEVSPGIPTARPITLDDALAYARTHQPAIQASLARVRTEEANAKVPWGEWQPTLGATAQIFGATPNNTTASYFVPEEMALPRIGGSTAVTPAGATWKPYASTLVGASIFQEVFDFGRIAAAAAAADAKVEIRKHGSDAERLDVELGVEEAYFAVWAAKGVWTASEEAYQRTRTHRDLAKAGVDSGLRSPIELTRAEADLSRYDIGRIRARGGLLVAQSVLAASMGAPELSLDVSGAPPSPAALPSLARSIETAAARDPVLLEALARLKAQEKTTGAIGARLRPNLVATGTLSGRAGGGAPSGDGPVPAGNGFLPDVPNWDVGLILSWTLFDGVTFAERNASRAEEAVRKDEVALYKEQEVAAVENSYVRVTVANAALPALKSAVTGAVANYAQADARFRAGLGNAVELADAEALRTDADVQFALGLFEATRARAIFGRAIAEGL